MNVLSCCDETYFCGLLFSVNPTFLFTISKNLKNMSENITVTTGIYDAIKEQLRRKKVSIAEEARLTAELRGAKQVLRRDLPEDVVTVDRKVTLKDHTADTQNEYIFVASTKAKPKKNKHSILSNLALAVVGYKVGDVINWPFQDGERKLEILNVEPWMG